SAWQAQVLADHEEAVIVAAALAPDRPGIVLPFPEEVGVVDVVHAVHADAVDPVVGEPVGDVHFHELAGRVEESVDAADRVISLQRARVLEEVAAERVTVALLRITRTPPDMEVGEVAVPTGYLAIE